MNPQEVGQIVISAATQVHESLEGAGLDLIVYRNALAYELEQRGLTVEKRTIPPGKYPGVQINRPEIVDMAVDNQVIVLCKTDTHPSYEAQALAQLRMTGLKLALIINFGERSVRSNIRRVVNAEN